MVAVSEIEELFGELFGGLQGGRIERLLKGQLERLSEVFLEDGICYVKKLIQTKALVIFECLPLFEDSISPWYVLFGDSISPSKILFGDSTSPCKIE